MKFRSANWRWWRKIRNRPSSENRGSDRKTADRTDKKESGRQERSDKTLRFRHNCAMISIRFYDAVIFEVQYEKRNDLYLQR